VILELLKELTTLLTINFVRDDDCGSDGVPVVEHNSEVCLEGSLTEGKALDAARILENLSLEDGLRARIDAL